jgi:TonB family protein
MMARYVLLLTVLTPTLITAQTVPTQLHDQATAREFHRQLMDDGIYIFISSKVAESLIIHRVEPVLPHGDMVARVSGTVVVVFEISKDGKVRRAMVVSGPKLLQSPVLAAVKQWTFKPYLLRGEPTGVETSIQLTVSNF